LTVTIVGDKACPQCRENGRDKTGNHLILFSNGGAYCNRCQYKEFPTETQEEETITSSVKFKDVINFKSAHLPDRYLSESIVQFYGIKVEHDQASGEIAAHYYPVYRNGKLIDYKCRRLPKTFYSVTKDSKGDTDLFGQQLFKPGGKHILITGGELDAPSAYHMIKSQYPDIDIAVVSPTKGENLSSIKPNLDYIGSFDNIYIAPDQDKAGEKFTSDLAGLFDSKLKVLKLEENDPNDMLVAGKEKEFLKAFFNAETYKPSGVITALSVRERAIQIPEYGRPFPWPTLTQATYGRRIGDGYYFGAGVKIGKSELLNQLVEHIIFTEKSKVFVAKPEELPELTVKKIAGKHYQIPFHDPDAYKAGRFSQEELANAIDAVGDRLLMFNRYSYLEWEELKACIRHAVVVEGVQDVFIDPITCFTDGKDSGEADRLLKQIARDLDNMSKDLGFTFYCFCHLNNPPKGGKSYEEGGRVKSAYFANSRSMMRACQYMVGVERNKYAEDPMERNTSVFRLLEDRNFGRYVEFPVFYNHETGSYLEI